MEPAGEQRRATARGTAIEVFGAFLRLGLTSFGGPIAHLGYMRGEFVRRRGWVEDARFAQLLAVCQFLPGPASSQLGFAIGLLRAGWGGALAAFAGFTLPSAVLMAGFAGLALHLDTRYGAAIVHGLKLVAVVVVAHGLAGMARQLTPDLPRALVAAATCAFAVLAAAAWAHLVAILAGAILGARLCRGVTPPAAARFPLPYGRRMGLACLGLFLAGLAAALLAPAGSPGVAGLAAAFYRAGALVFGGGHVVLPLLEGSLVRGGWMDAGTFMAGYGAAQAVPGPMFSLAAFLGAEVPTGLPAPAGALVALLAVFLPGFLLVLAVLPFWSFLARWRHGPGVVAGINAAVVGLLAAAFLDPVLVQGITRPADVAIAAAGFVALASARLGPLWVVLGCVAASLALAFQGG